MVAGRGRRRVGHTADEGFEVWGADMGALLEEAAAALFEAMGTPQGTAASAAGEVVVVTCRGVDREDLLVRTLSELLVRFSVDGTFVTRAACESAAPDADGWTARLRCDALTVPRETSSALTEVKAVTYHGLRVHDEVGGGLRATVYLDL